MNSRAAEALFEAERKGVRQIVGRNTDGEGGRCAMGVLYESWAWSQGFIPVVSEKGNYVVGITASLDFCREYGLSPEEGERIVELNNNDRLTLAEIARKLGPDGV